ncbi:MAG TPA: PAS domain-containing protein, partial [Thermoanaerobaculia bacterium]|nr:PAS domain-containing protein [Thermoanaerobaculia bacterium]
MSRQREEALRAEAAALESWWSARPSSLRRQLAEALVLAQVGSFRNDLRTKTMIWSEECYRIFEMPPEEGGASYRAFLARVHPDDLESVTATLQAAIAGRSAFVHDHRLLLPNGTTKWVHGRCEFTYDDTGQPLTAIGTLQDISDRKAVEEALQHSEQLLRIASRIGRIGGWAVDLSASTTVSWSDEVCAIHGMPAGYRPSLEEAINFYAPECRDVIRSSVEECIRTRTPYDVELQIINATGQRVWVRAVGEAEFDGAGAVTGLRGALQDISERMAALRALRESDQRFRLVAQATSDVVWDWNLADDQCWWSEGLQTKLGYPPGHPAASFWRENIHPEDRERVLTSVETAISSGETWSEEYGFRSADGTYVVISDRALVTFDEVGRACRMIGAMVDVTAQRTLEARLVEAKRVSSVGELAANMAHDFNNVLMGIQPFVELIRRVTPDIPRAQDAVARIVQSLTRGKAITDDILQLTRRVEPIAKPNVHEWLLDFASRADASAGAQSSDDASPAGPGREAAAAAAVQSAARPGGRRPSKVLIIDDEPAVVDGIAMLLSSEGMSTTSVFEGGKAIAAIEEHTPELVLLDIGLPDLSGVEVFGHIYERWPTLRVVLMTGHYRGSDLSEILELPHVSFLQKPFGADELLTAIVG